MSDRSQSFRVSYIPDGEIRNLLGDACPWAVYFEVALSDGSEERHFLGAFATFDEALSNLRDRGPSLDGFATWIVPCYGEEPKP